MTYKSAIHDLPDGTMIEINSKAYLIWTNGLYRWSFSGYSKSEMENKATEEVIVLTPKSYVETFSKGFTPEVHESI